MQPPTTRLVSGRPSRAVGARRNAREVLGGHRSGAAECAGSDQRTRQEPVIGKVGEVS